MRFLLTLFVIMSTLYSVNSIAAINDVLQPGSVIILNETAVEAKFGGPDRQQARQAVEKDFDSFYKYIQCDYTASEQFFHYRIICTGIPRTVTLPHFKINFE